MAKSDPFTFVLVLTKSLSPSAV